jgi:hypothetical protein
LNPELVRFDDFPGAALKDPYRKEHGPVDHECVRLAGAAPGPQRFLGELLRLGEVAAQECFTCAVEEGEPPQAGLSEVVSEGTRPREVPLSRLELTA